MSIANNRREIFRKNPKDITNDIAIGISYPFDNRVFNSTYTTKDQLRSNLINFLLTNKGEKLFDPNFGTDLKYRLFEPIDDTLEELITNSLTDGVQQYLPELEISSFIYNPSEDQHKVEISVTYKYLLDNTTDTVNLQING
jgi:phage baseplate assembly protein W